MLRALFAPSGFVKQQSGYSPFVPFYSTTFFRLLELLRNSFIATEKTSFIWNVKRNKNLTFFGNFNGNVLTLENKNGRV
jgi:hypothetical protein